MFEKIICMSDQSAEVKLATTALESYNFMNLHLVFEDPDKKVLAEVDDIKDGVLKVRFLGEIVNGRLVGGVLRKPMMSASIRVIEQNEIPMIVGQHQPGYVLMGMSPFYNDTKVYFDVGSFFSNQFAIFGTSGIGKSC